MVTVTPVGGLVTPADRARGQAEDRRYMEGTAVEVDESAGSGDENYYRQPKGTVISGIMAQTLADVAQSVYVLGRAGVAPATAYAPRTEENAENEGFGVAIPIRRNNETVVAIFKAQTTGEGENREMLRDAAGNPVLERDAEGKGIVVAYVGLESNRAIHLAQGHEEHRPVPTSAQVAAAQGAAR